MEKTLEKKKKERWKSKKQVLKSVSYYILLIKVKYIEKSSWVVEFVINWKQYIAIQNNIKTNDLKYLLIKAKYDFTK